MNALIIVDMQNDFCPGGALAVNEGDQIVGLINRIQNQFRLVVATQDWHPPDHKSFASSHNRKVGEVIELDGLQQVLWPDHCIQNSKGAALVPGLTTRQIERVFQKGTDPNIDSYSGFFDNGHRKDTGLSDFLKAKGVTKVFIVGLATDYCVKYTALDAARLNFETWVIRDAVRGVELNPGDIKRAFEEMASSGVQLTTSSQVIR